MPEGIVHLRSTYPMSRYFAAFDLRGRRPPATTRIHELIRFGVPALYVPMPRQTDDQAARARYAEQAGIGLAADGPDSDRIEALLDELLDPERRASMRERLGELRFEDGAAEAARWLGELARAEAPARRGRCGAVAALASPAPALGAPGGPVRRPPAAARRGLRQADDRAPAAAHGGAGARGCRRRPRARARGRPRPHPRSAGRVLVITDSLDFGPLLRAGVGFEHVPGPGEAQAQLAGGDYHAFLSRRLALILAERPRPRRALTIGDTGDAGLPAPKSPERPLPSRLVPWAEWTLRHRRNRLIKRFPPPATARARGAAPCPTWS